MNNLLVYYMNEFLFFLTYKNTNLFNPKKTALQPMGLEKS